MEVGEILDGIVRWVDERYGKRAAWIALLVGLLVASGIFILIIWYLSGV